MSDSSQNEGKKANSPQEEANRNNTGNVKGQKEQHQKQVREGLNPQEDGDENNCPDEKSDTEPENGSVCEFQ
jgi:hypothetical protein